HEGAAAANASRLVDDLPPLRALLASVKTTVPGKRCEEARASAPERNPSAADGRVPHTGDALLGVAAPAGIALVAGRAVNWIAGETLTLASGQASNLAVAGNLRVHSGQAIGVLAAAAEGQVEDVALGIVAGNGELDVQARNDEIRLRSRDQLRVASANAEVELLAGKTVHLATAGGASLTIEDGNIVVACPGTIKVHAGKKSFAGPTQLSREVNGWPGAKFDDAYVVRHELTGEPLSDVVIEMRRDDGAVMRLVTVAMGRLQKQKREWYEMVTMHIRG